MKILILTLFLTSTSAFALDGRFDLSIVGFYTYGIQTKDVNVSTAGANSLILPGNLGTSMNYGGKGYLSYDTGVMVNYGTFDGEKSNNYNFRLGLRTSFSRLTFAAGVMRSHIVYENKDIPENDVEFSENGVYGRLQIRGSKKYGINYEIYDTKGNGNSHYGTQLNFVAFFD
jgi:hypothetical protein